MFEEDDSLWDEFFLTHPQGNSKMMENLRNEFVSLMKELDNGIRAKSDKERDYNVLTIELATLRDQIRGSRQATQESIAAQHALREQLEQLTVKGRENSVKELSNREEITVLSTQFDGLHRAIATGAGWTPEQEEQRHTLLRERDFMSRKLENQTVQVNTLRNEISRIMTVIHDTEHECNKLDEEKQNISVKITNLNRQVSGILIEHQGYSKVIGDTQDAIQQALVDLAERNNLRRTGEKALQSLDNELTSSKAQMAEYLSDYDSLLQTLQEMSVSLSRQKAQNKKLEEELAEKEKGLKIRRKDVETLLKENQKLLALKELAHQKMMEIDIEKKELEERREELVNKTEQMRDVHIRGLQREIETYNRQRASLHAELALVKKKYYSADNIVSSLSDMLNINANTFKNLTLEKSSLYSAISAQQGKIDQITSEKEHLEHDAERMNQQYYTELEELKLQELQVKELQKKIAEDSSKLKQKQNLYEVVRSDRNLYSKQLVSLQSDISTLRSTFKQMNHTIEQQKEDISVRDSLIVKEHFLHHSVERERELLKNQLIKSRKQVLSSKDIVENQQVEIVKLSRIINEADQERSRQKNELAAVLAERNLLTSQVVKRNAELQAVYSKIKVQRNSLRMGERQYDVLMQQIFTWQQELVQLVRDKQIVMSKFSDSDVLKQQQIRLERELATIQIKTRAVYDELELPMNIHRWRLLESSDPIKYELICKVQELQAQLIEKSDLVVAKVNQIKVQEKVYMELKMVIARQPGPEVEEQILVYQQTLKDKVKQQKAMEEELDMYRQQVSIFNSDISEITTQMEKLKKQWFKSVKLNRTQ